MKRRLLRARGFTLIEMLVVFTLLALLLSIAAPRYMTYAENAKVKARETNMATIRDALDKYRADRGKFPPGLQDLIDKKYLRAIPIDPVSATTEWVEVRDGTGVTDITAPKEDAPQEPPQ